LRRKNSHSQKTLCVAEKKKNLSERAWGNKSRSAAQHRQNFRGRAASQGNSSDSDRKKKRDEVQAKRPAKKSTVCIEQKKKKKHKKKYKGGPKETPVPSA